VLGYMDTISTERYTNALIVHDMISWTFFDIPDILLPYIHS